VRPFERAFATRKPYSMKLDGEKKEAWKTALDFLSRRAAVLLCALLLTLMAVEMLAVIRQKSITVDEWVMIPAGYYHLTAGDFRPVNEHPPFAKILAATPLLMIGAQAPTIAAAPHDDDYFADKLDDFWHQNAARFDYLSFWARVPAILVTVLLGALVFVYARRYWGARAALFAVALFSLEPTVLAHGRVVQTDIPSALGLLLFSFTFYEYLKAPNINRALWVGWTVGLAAVTKFSMIALVPVVGLVLVILFIFAPRRGLKRAHVAGHALAFALTAVLAVNAAYLFQHRQPDPLYDVGVDEVSSTRLETGFYALRFILPTDFISGIEWQLDHTREGHQAGLLGMWSKHGWWYYFPVAFALKTPLPILLMSLAGLVWALVRLRREPEGRLLVLVLPLVLFTCLLMLSTINIGVRYYLPAYPFFFILSGAMLDDLLRRAGHRAIFMSLLVAALFCWVAIEAVRAYPDHMTYMNQLASRAPHWWYLSDSNVEWGDDVRDLALYLRSRGERRIGEAILNRPLLDMYGIESTPVFAPPGDKPEEVRYVAIGASFLNGSVVHDHFDDDTPLSETERVNYFDQYRRRTPEKIFGNSIYLYRMK